MEIMNTKQAKEDLKKDGYCPECIAKILEECIKCQTAVEFDGCSHQTIMDCPTMYSVEVCYVCASKENPPTAKAESGLKQNSI